MRSTSLSSLAFLFLVSCAGTEKSARPVPPVTAATVERPPTPPHGKPRFGSFGIDLAGLDKSVKPGNDFSAFANGGWAKETQIPPDKARWGVFDMLREESDANVRRILEETGKANLDKGTNARKAADYFAAYLDTAAIEQKGLAPAKAALDAIDGAKTLDDIAKLMARADLPSDGPIAAGVSLDQKNPDAYVIEISHAGLGLPEREFYLNKDKQFEEIRAKYAAHIAKLLGLAGDKNAAANARAIVALETKIAERHWPIAERREREKTYNPRTLAELEKEAGAFPWKAFLGTHGYGGESKFIVSEATAIPKLAQLFAATPVSTWKAYLRYHFLRGSADVLPKAFDDEVFDFAGRTLNGQPEQRERWKRAVSAVNGALGDAVGELYVAKHFKPQAKVEMDELVRNVRKAYGARIQEASWLTPETKKLALEKLEAFRPKIGYPSKWKNYAALEIVPGDAYGNARRAAVWGDAYDRARLGKPTDRDEWFMSPQTVNAYYNAVFNEIVFPAAVLQPPFFDPEADPAVNYGAVGAVIGHEMGHGFDDQGAKSDAKGVLRTWWTDADVAAFKKRTDVLAEQYAAFEPLPGIKLNGRLTLGENIGDVGGLTVAHRAYELSLGGKPAPTLDGYTGEQRFFLGWAQVWRELMREPALRNQVLTNPHSPGKYRINGVVRNMDAWYPAFGVKEGDALYLAPEKRVSVW